MMYQGNGLGESRRGLIMSKAKEAVGRLIETMDKGGGVRWARKTNFIPQSDGTLRRVITRSNGVVERDEILTEKLTLVAVARAKSGMSQNKFAKLLGISPSTLRDWEQGRSAPSGAAKTLLRIAANHPEVLCEVS